MAGCVGDRCNLIKGLVMGRRRPAMLVIALLLAVGTVASCGTANTSHPATPTTITAAKLDGLLLSVGDINSVMGTSAMTLADQLTDMSDHSYLLPNRNCLGIWQIGEKAIYGDSGYGAIRGQDLRQPNTETWDALVIQAVVNYPSADAAKKFFAASADRWSKCTNNHKVNITLNGLKMAPWTFGAFTRTDTELTMHVTRGSGERSCQRALSIAANVVIDVAACNAAATNQGATIVDKIRSKVPS
jgi:PknH-like extracellular domain